MTQIDVAPATDTASNQRIAVFDADVHPKLMAVDLVMANLSEQWQEYLKTIGMRLQSAEMGLPTLRQWAHRRDAEVPGGGEPGSDPAWAREQLLDTFGMSGAMLNNIGPLMLRGTGQLPFELQRDLVRALNDWLRDAWIASDRRWYASINVTSERPDEAVREIERCRASSDHFAQVVLERRADYPHGNPRYWPIYEACEALGIPVGFHVSGGKRVTASGNVNFYVEDHVDFALSNFNCLASFVFEGVFERFPGLKIVFIEQNWSWSIPFSWRMDGAWRMLRAEVPHLQRKPSEYVRDHVYFTSQPMEEPENLEEYGALVQLLDESGSGDKLMFSSDYPHWDFDSPLEAVPEWLPLDTRRKILGENASKLYGISLDEPGIPAHASGFGPR